jgi:hypothetical protein
VQVRRTFDDTESSPDAFTPPHAHQPRFDLLDELSELSRICRQQFIEFCELARAEKHFRHAELVVVFVETKSFEKRLKFRIK